ncbi:MAG: hypothetical protein ABR589_07665 [Chthoniobacterales bacterium]
MEIAIERLVALCCLGIGLSHIFQPRAWVKLFILWREKGEVGALYTGLLQFQFGALIVSFHNVWHGIPAVVTVLGWAWTIKGLLYLTYPKHPMRMLARISIERSWEFVVAGALLFAIGVLITCSLVARNALL